MSSFAEKHRAAHGKVAAVGKPVVFREPFSEKSCSGVAFQDEGGDPERYRELSLVQSHAPTLFFVADEYGTKPEPGMVCGWSGNEYTARDVAPFAPDGVPIYCNVIVAR